MLGRAGEATLLSRSRLCRPTREVTTGVEWFISAYVTLLSRTNSDLMARRASNLVLYHDQDQVIRYASHTRALKFDCVSQLFASTFVFLPPSGSSIFPRTPDVSSKHARVEESHPCHTHEQSLCD